MKPDVLVVEDTESKAEDKRRGLLACANSYIVKPSSPEPMIQGIWTVMGIDAAQFGQTGRA